MRRLFSLLFTLVLSLPFVPSVSTTSKNQKQKLGPPFWDFKSSYPSSLSPSLTSSRLYRLIFKKKEGGGNKVKIEDRRADDRDDDDDAAAAAEAVEKKRSRNPGRSKDCFFPA